MIIVITICTIYTKGGKKMNNESLKEWLLYQKSLCEKNMDLAIAEKSDFMYWSGQIDALSNVLNYMED